MSMKNIVRSISIKFSIVLILLVYGVLPSIREKGTFTQIKNNIFMAIWFLKKPIGSKGTIWSIKTFFLSGLPFWGGKQSREIALFSPQKGEENILLAKAGDQTKRAALFSSYYPPIGGEKEYCYQEIQGEKKIKNVFLVKIILALSYILIIGAYYIIMKYLKISPANLIDEHLLAHTMYV